MKYLFVTVALLALMFVTASPSYAAGKMSVGAGLDVLIPVGSFGDGSSTGFGGSGIFQYNVNQMFAVTGKLGYWVFGGKDFSEGGVNISGPSFKGFTIRVGGKYYFMPAGRTRVYGMGELGLFFGSSGDVTIPGVTIPGFGTVGGGTVSGGSSTDFVLAPIVGVELPFGGKGNTIDISARYDLILTSGNSAGSLGLR
ncbi:MAG: outer membrane beta-barrel protein, partial [Ignavibacteria bacterium]|nr:outer membrane beta-barrel protein [Ignavibacteria bacterium]